MACDDVIVSSHELDFATQSQFSIAFLKNEKARVTY